MHDLREAGVGAETVARLVREGTVMLVVRGLYQLADAMPDPPARLRGGLGSRAQGRDLPDIRAAAS